MLLARPAHDEELKPSNMPPFPMPKGCAVAFGTDEDEEGAPAAEGHGGSTGVGTAKPGAATAGSVVVPFGKAMGGTCPYGAGGALSMAHSKTVAVAARLRVALGNAPLPRSNTWTNIFCFLRHC